MYLFLGTGLIYSSPKYTTNDYSSTTIADAFFNGSFPQKYMPVVNELRKTPNVLNKSSLPTVNGWKPSQISTIVDILNSRRHAGFAGANVNQSGLIKIISP